jgi:hypothetical protein
LAASCKPALFLLRPGAVLRAQPGKEVHLHLGQPLQVLAGQSSGQVDERFQQIPYLFE